MANIVAAIHHGVVLVVANAEPPEPAAWDAYMAVLAQAFERSEGKPVKLVIFAGGGVPDAGMRLKLRQVIASRPILTAVISDSAVVRGIIGVFSLFVAGTRPFASSDWKSALEYVGVPLALAPGLIAPLRQLDAEVRGSAALSALLKAER